MSKSKRDKLVEKLEDALSEDKTLQGDLGIQEVEEALLFILNEMEDGNIIPDDAKIKAGSREDPSHPEFKRNKDAVEDARENMGPASEGSDLVHGGPGMDKTENADPSLGRMNESNPETDPDKMGAEKVREDAKVDFPGPKESPKGRK